jgi:hypothetical protein
MSSRMPPGPAVVYGAKRAHAAPFPQSSDGGEVTPCNQEAQDDGATEKLKSAVSIAELGRAVYLADLWDHQAFIAVAMMALIYSGERRRYLE